MDDCRVMLISWFISFFRSQIFLNFFCFSYTVLFFPMSFLRAGSYNLDDTSNKLITCCNNVIALVFLKLCWYFSDFFRRLWLTLSHTLKCDDQLGRFTPLLQNHNISNNEEVSRETTAADVLVDVKKQKSITVAKVSPFIASNTIWKCLEIQWFNWWSYIDQ